MVDSPAPTTPLQVRYQNTAEDWAALQKSLTPGQRFMQRWGTVLVLAAFVVLCCFPATAVLLAFGQATAVLAGWALAGVFLLIMIYVVARSWRAPDPETLRPATVSLHKEYLEVAGDRGWEQRDWALISRLQPTDELFILHRDDGLVYAVPRRAFASPADEQAFIAAAQRWHDERSGSELDQPPPWQNSAPAAVFSADTLQVSYSTAAPELAELKHGMVLHPVDAAPQKKAKPNSPVGWLLLGVVIALMFLLLSRGEPIESGSGILIGILFFPVSALLMVFPSMGILRFFTKRRQKPARAVTQTLTISPAGVSLWAPGLETRSTWEAIDAVQENEKVIVFAANRPAAVHLYVVPKPAFGDEFEARHFAQTAAHYRRAAHDALEEQKLTEIPRAVSDNPYQPPLAR